jgi:hypothetical protein
MRCLFVAVLISFVLVVYASAIELFRYNLTTPDGRKFQYIFDVSDPAFQSAGDALSREEIIMSQKLLPMLLTNATQPTRIDGISLIVADGIFHPVKPARH